MGNHFRAAVDGGARGNPGLAAWGVAVLDAQGDYVEGWGGTLGHATNNVAEYHGLLEALKLAEQQGADVVEIVADSQLIVRQIRGSYRVRHPDLKPLHDEAMQRIEGFGSFRIRHVQRGDNRRADRLVNMALDRAEGDERRVRVHDEP